MKTSILSSRDPIGRPQSNLATSSPMSMELGAICGSPALVKTTTERLEFQRQGKCWGCRELNHIRAGCPTNPS